MLLEKVIFSHMEFFLSIYFWDFWGAIFLPKRCQIVAVKLLHQMENTLLYTICVFIKMQCNNITPAEGKFAMRTNLSLTLKDHHVFRSFQCLKNACFFWLWRSAPTPKHVYIYKYFISFLASQKIQWLQTSIYHSSKGNTENPEFWDAPGQFVLIELFIIFSTRLFMKG